MTSTAGVLRILELLSLLFKKNFLSPSLSLPSWLFSRENVLSTDLLFLRTQKITLWKSQSDFSSFPNSCFNVKVLPYVPIQG